jgi:hypothetical protein
VLQQKIVDFSQVSVIIKDRAIKFSDGWVHQQSQHFDQMFLGDEHLVHPAHAELPWQ